VVILAEESRLERYTMGILPYLILAGFSLFTHPEETQVVVLNQLNDQSITSIHLLLPGVNELLPIEMPLSIPPDESIKVTVPWGFINRLIFRTDSGTVYYQGFFAASSKPDTIRICLARKEFGGVFDRIYGTFPIAVRNRTGVNIASVLVQGDSLPPGDILGRNPIMPGESLRLWVTSTEPCSLVFIDLDGFLSDTMIVAANPDTIYELTNEMFYHNGTHHSTSDPGYSLTIANCISSEALVSVEVLDELGNSALFFDLTQTPLGTWDRLTTQIADPPSLVICTDSEGREYSLDRPDSISGIYDFDLLSLNFDFSFPEGQ